MIKLHYMLCRAVQLLHMAVRHGERKKQICFSFEWNSA